MSRHLYIAGVDRRADLERGSLRIEQALTYQIDTCSFSVKGEQPAEGEEVIVEDDKLGRLFAGIIVKVELGRTFPDKSIKVWNVDCDDYTALLDRRLVVESYENMSASDIFLDIVAKYCPGFTTNGVRPGAPVVESTGAEFEYKRPSECFRWLCDYVGWHWQPDYYKDLHFFSAEELVSPAPMVLRPGGKFRFGKHSIDTQGLRNRVYVRGGTMLSDPQVIQWKADGVARIWTLPWPPHEVSLTVGEVPMTVGVENLHDEEDFDYMMSFSEKYIRCSAQTATPVEGITMALTARQDIPVITMVEDYASQAAIAKVQGGDGIYEHIISDDSLISIAAAEAAGMADLREHGNPRVKGSFETEYSPAPVAVEKTVIEHTETAFTDGEKTGLVIGPNGLELAKAGQDFTYFTYSETSQADFQSGTLTDVVATSAGDLELATGKALGTREKVVDISSVGANNTGSIINFTKTDAVVTNATFTRASVAYLSDGSQVAANVPRFEFGQFGQAVMVEEGTTNSIVDPVFAVAASWPLKSRTTFKASGGWAQDTCVTLCEGSSGSGHCYQPQSLSDGQSGVMSVYVKMSDGSEPVIGNGTNQMLLVFGGHAPPVNKTYIGDGWWRLTAVITGPYSGYTGVVFYNADNTIYPIFSNIQLEKDKGYVTSFTPSTRSSEILTIPTAGVLSPQEGTVECWIYFDANSLASNRGNFWIIGTAKTNYVDRIVLQRLDSNLVFQVSNGTTITVISFPLSNITIGWHYLAARWSTSEVSLFLDGTKIATASNPNLPQSLAANCGIGYNIVSGEEQCNTLIDDLRISSRARTDAEILAAYQSGQPLPVDKWTTYKMDFDNNLQATVGTVNVEAALSVDGGDNYSQYSEVKSGLPIPGLAPDTDLTNGRLKIKETLYTSDVTVTPQLHSLTVRVLGEQYVASGYYLSPPLPLILNRGKITASQLSWDSEGEGVLVEVDISLDGGKTWQGWQECEAFGVIPVLPVGMKLSGSPAVRYRITLSTEDPSASPAFSQIDLSALAEVLESHNWQPGQIVEINLPDRGVEGEYLIQRVTITPTWSNPSIWTYRVEYGGRLLGIADFLKALVSAQQKKRLIEPTKNVQKYVYGEETLQLSDELTTTPRQLPFICGDEDAICGMVVVSDG